MKVGTFHVLTALINNLEDDVLYRYVALPWSISDSVFSLQCYQHVDIIVEHEQQKTFKPDNTVCAGERDERMQLRFKEQVVHDYK